MRKRFHRPFIRKRVAFNPIVAKFILFIMTALPIIYGVFLLLLAILGCVAFKKIGAYPYPKDLFEVLKGTVPQHTVDGNVAFDYTMGTPLGYVWGIFFISSYLIALVLNLEESIFRSITPLIAVSVQIGATVYVSKVHGELSMWGHELNGVTVLGLGFLAVIIISFLCLKKTVGGAYLLVTLILTLIQCFILPICLWFYSLSTKGKIGVIVAAVVYVLVLIFGPGYISGIGTSSSLGSGLARDENADILEQIGKRERIIKANEHGISEHLKGSVNYGHVDVKLSRDTIKKKQMEIDSLRDKLKKK